MPAPSPTAFLDEIERALEPLHVRHAEAQWALALTGADEAAGEVERCEHELTGLLADPTAFGLAEDGLRAADVEPPDRQRLRLYRDMALVHQVPRPLRVELIQRQVALEQSWGTFRATFEGRPVPDNALDDVLLHERDDDRRRAAWEATRQVGREVAGSVRELAELRNRVARKLDRRDWFHLALEADQLDAPWLASQLDTLERGTAVRHHAILTELGRDLSARLDVPQDALLPWHYPDRFLQRLPSPDTGLDNAFPVASIEANTKATFEAIGLSIGQLWEAGDLHPRAGKSQHAFCLAVDPPTDVRVLCNLAPGSRWMSTALHEFGHAVYDHALDPALPLLVRQPAHTLVTEGVAMYFGRLVHDPRWLAEIAGMPASHAADEHLRREQVIFMRWAMVVVRFEEALYDDPQGDLDRRWWELVEQLQGLRRPPGHDAPDWAAKVHIGCHPVYYQNYILGELVASQLAHAARTRGPGIFQRLFALGASRPWQETLAEVTGSPLLAEHWLGQMTRSG